MTSFSTLTDHAGWQRDFEQRMRASYRAGGFSEVAAEHKVGTMLGGLEDCTVAEVGEGGARVGFVAVTVADDHGTLRGRVVDLRIDPDHGGRGHEQAARDWAERYCAERGAVRLAVQLAEPTTLFDDYPLRAQTRMRAGIEATPLPDGFSVRPMTPAEYALWLAEERTSYGATIAEVGALDPAHAQRRADREFAESMPQGQDTPDHTFLVLEMAGVPIGTGWLKHGFHPGVTFGYALRIDQKYRGRGYGRVAMAVGAQATVAAGDSALLFNVFGGNTVAMNLYDSAGFRVVDEVRSIDLPRAEP
ncbi:GNAT family N-acetyltransferase [Kitasatospora mediocidica]|uniref:GNAT family N-acetyltransferase n=1 Tax=Kitasatospora mediocidica TaxID=58352 RepID=UPI00056456E4|nr:GNAT family N-acetyltransferase [Kitasatospora mediocidica]